MKVSGLSVTYLGHGTMLFQTASGKRILIDPWVQGNPGCPEDKKKLERVDVMLITHGHFDHIGDAVAIAKEHSPTVVGIYETCAWLESKGVEKLSGMNKGGSQVVEGVKITMVHADHSCGIMDDGKIIYGGEAVGYVLKFENGPTVYHSGDTAVFGDMALIAKLYKPQIACLPIGDFYTMSPYEAGYAVRMIKPKTVIPMHYGTFPVLIGTPDALRKEIKGVKGVKVLGLKPGESSAL